MQRMNTDLVDRLCGKQYIPPRPAILINLQKRMDEEYPDIIRIAGLISRDVGLSAAVLKNVNSAFFGMQRHVSDIRQAAVLLGLNKLIYLVTAYEMRKALSGNACISLGRFWDTSRDTAKACTRIAHSVVLSVPLEDLYAFGLFHNCGIALMAMCFPDYKEFLQVANNDYEHPMTTLENERYQVNHAQVGYSLIDAWNLPLQLGEIVLQHHEVDYWESVDQLSSRQAMAALKLGEQIVDRYQRGIDNVDWPRSQKFICDVLDMTPERMEEVMEKVMAQLDQD